MPRTAQPMRTGQRRRSWAHDLGSRTEKGHEDQPHPQHRESPCELEETAGDDEAGEDGASRSESPVSHQGQPRSPGADGGSDLEPARVDHPGEEDDHGGDGQGDPFEKHGGATPECGDRQGQAE